MSNTTPHDAHTLEGPADCRRCQLLRDNQHWMATPSPSFLDVTVTVKMTPEQRENYAIEYGLDTTEVLADVTGRLQNDVSETLHGCYWLREFTSYSVSAPK